MRKNLRPGLKAAPLIAPEVVKVSLD